jgi:signal transduction histidine kinase
MNQGWMEEMTPTSPPSRKRNRLHAPRINLTIKLLAAFVLVVVAATTTVAVMAGQLAEREFTRFIRENQTEPSSDTLTRLIDLYAQQGNWAGAEEIMGQIGITPSDRQRTPPLALIDNQGRVIAQNWGPKAGDEIPEEMLADGWPLQIDGETIATLVLPLSGKPPLNAVAERLSPEDARTVERVQRAILTTGAIAGSVALIVAGLLAWGLVRPLRRLTAAANGIARGDLSQRVPVTRGDEVGELAATFNHMAGELERGEQLRRNMTADVAHELRTPLSVIRGKLEGVLDGVYPATSGHLEPVLEATELLTYLVEDLRLLAQAEAGQLTLEKRLVNIGDLLSDARVNFDPQASDRGVTLALDVPGEIPEVTADWHRVAQVLGNLLTNALRHTPAGGRVTLSASVQHQRESHEGNEIVKVTVADTGTGIPSEDLPNVFERFWRGERSRSRAGGGTGLGLAIAKQLVELHGGTIGAESIPGEGSVFWFTLTAV